MKKIILAVILIAGIGMLSAIFNDYQPSARARAMSGAYTAISDDASGVFFNPAGIYSAPAGATIGMAELFGQDFTELKAGAVVYPLPKGYGVIGVGAKLFDVDYEDYTLMSESQLTLAHGFSLMKDIHSSLDVGWSANLYNLAMESYDDDTAYGINVGAVATMHQRTRFGFSVSNLNHPKIGNANRHDIPRKFNMAISYAPYDQVITTIEMKKDFAEDTEFMAGVELKLFEPLYLRAGVHQNPATWSCGASFKMVGDFLKMNGITLDYSFTQHTVLEPTHFLNISYDFGRK